jgi:capsular polysaccharide biosynthesis protein
MDAIDSPAIAEEVIKRLGLSGIEPGELLENLALAKAGGSFIVVKLSYKDTNPQRAQRIANTVAQVASERIRKETPYVYVLDVQSWGKAKLPSTPVSPNHLRNVLALISGLMVGIGLAIWMDERASRS